MDQIELGDLPQVGERSIKLPDEDELNRQRGATVTVMTSEL